MAFPLRSIDARFWRMLAIRWQRDPLAGIGAARMGGRWNRPGQAALYLSADHATAVAEFHQGLPHPGTLVPVDVQSDAIVDLVDPGVRDSLGLSPADLCVDWRKMVELEGTAPPGWQFADRLANVDGLRVPSIFAPGVNLVLWRWSADGGNGARVRLIDPNGDLAPG